MCFSVVNQGAASSRVLLFIRNDPTSSGCCALSTLECGCIVYARINHTFPRDYKAITYYYVHRTVFIDVIFVTNHSYCLFTVHPSALQNSFSYQCYSKDFRKQCLYQMTKAGISVTGVYSSVAD